MFSIVSKTTATNRKTIDTGVNRQYWLGIELRNGDLTRFWQLWWWWCFFLHKMEDNG